MPLLIRTASLFLFIILTASSEQHYVTMKFKVVNHSRDRVFAALAYQSMGGMSVLGWFSAEPGAATQIPNLHADLRNLYVHVAKARGARQWIPGSANELRLFTVNGEQKSFGLLKEVGDITMTVTEANYELYSDPRGCPVD